MSKASFNEYLTADQAQCARCGVTQKQSAMQQLVRLRPLKGSSMSDLRRIKGEFVRDVQRPPDRHTEAELKKQEAAPWYCVDPERCARHRIDVAVKAERERVMLEMRARFGFTQALSRVLTKRKRVMKKLAKWSKP